MRYVHLVNEHLPTISLTYTPDLNDHLRAPRLLYLESAWSKVDKVVAVLLALFGVYMVWADGIYWWTLIWFALAVVEWFNLLTLQSLQVRLWFKREPKFRDEYCLTFTPDHIHFQTASIDSTLDWSYYGRVLEGKTIFLLFYGKGLYSVIPKRCFGSESDLEAFRTLLKEKIPEYKYIAA